MVEVFEGNARPHVLAKLAPTVAKLIVAIALLGVVLAQFALVSLILAGVGVAGAAVLGLWGAANNARRVRVGLSEGKLGFGDGRFHELAPDSLFAVRGGEVDDLSLRYTAIYVKLDSGRWRVLAFMDMVPDGSFTKQRKLPDDIWFEPDQNELLQLLVPYVARSRDSEASAVPRFTIPLRGPIGEGWDYDKLVIEGESLTLLKAGATVATAGAATILCEPYVFLYQPNVHTHPEGIRALALRLSFPQAAAPLTIGAESAWSYELPAGLRQLDVPYYLVGAAELFRLKAVLEGARAEDGEDAD